MANRLNAPNQFETLSPPWILSQLDTNFTQNQAAWNDSSLGFVNGIPIDTGSANAYTVALPFGSPSAYQDGMPVVFIPANSNTAASTITVSPLGSVAILNPAGIALNGGEIIKNVPLLITYKSAVPTGFRIVGPCSTFINFGTVGTSQTVNCAGYTNLTINANFTAVSLGVTLNNVSFGATITLVLTNSSGGNSAFGCTMTDAAGNTVTPSTVQAGQNNVGSTAFNATVYTTGSVANLRGSYISLGSFLFSR